MWDGLQEILFTLRQNKLRTLLTAFGVFWGIFMLILMLGAGKGMQNGVYDGFGGDVSRIEASVTKPSVPSLPIMR